MGAPDTTVWGDIVTSSEKETRQGKLGIYLEPTTTSTQVSIKVQVWFWSRAAVDDKNNEFYFDVGTTNATTYRKTVTVNHTSNTGWSTNNQTLCYEDTYPYNRASSKTTATFAAKLSGIDIIGKTMTVNASYDIPALQTYPIIFHRNDGSGMFHGGITKTHGQTIKLMAAPTRDGYTFANWNTKADGTGTPYAAGSDYTRDAYTELYAIWIPHTYTITYNVNGGTAVASQTKTHDKPLTLSGTPTKDGYIFQGWSASSSALTATYQPGSIYTQEGDATLYAVWLLGYKPPRIYNVSVKRCTSTGEIDDAGSYAKVYFEWDTDKTVDTATVEWSVAGTNSWSSPLPLVVSGVKGINTVQIGSGTDTSANYLDPEVTYSIRITVTDEKGSNDVIRSLFSQKFTIDFVYEKVLDQNGNVQSEGTGVAFGKTAELANTVEFAYDAKFDKPVYGKALGMDAVTLILAGADFNDYVDPGCYAVHVSDNAKNITNCPAPVAGRLEVWSSTGNGVQPSGYSYIRQCYHPLELKYGVMERDLHRYYGGDWQYGEWVYTKPSKVVLFVSDKTKEQETGSIPLNEAVTDFAYLEIFYTDNNGILGGYTKINVNWTAEEETDTNKKYVDLSIVEASTSTTTMIRRTRYNISGSMLIPDTTKAGASQLNHSSTVNHQFATSNLIRITKVVGYYE